MDLKKKTGVQVSLKRFVSAESIMVHIKLSPYTYKDGISSDARVCK